MKTIFITGASSGLGKETAKLFQRKGWRVIATMRNPEKEQELNLLNNVHLLAMDVTDSVQVKQAFKEAVSIATIDVVFNNAGYGLVGPFETYTEQQIARQIDTNLNGVLRVAHPFVSYFREKGIKGIFITTTSIYGIVGNPLSSIYCATKFALEGWSESMGYDMAAFGIKFKTIAPGGIKTSFAGVAMDVTYHEAYNPILERMTKGFESGELIHFTEPEEIAQRVYEAATDGTDTIRYVAGIDAVEISRLRDDLGIEANSRRINEIYKV